MENLKKYILEQVAKNHLPVTEAEDYLKHMDSKETKDIAIIGLDCRLSKANNAREFWDNLINRRNCLDAFPESRYAYAETFQMQLGGATSESDLKSLRRNYPFKAGYLDDIDKFDANYFNIPPREAKHMDPRQRFFLEVAWSAVEDAGYNKETFYGSNTGVFVGEDKTGSTFYRMIVEDDPLVYTGTWEGILASRISYIFNLRGPALVVDTACSSGLAALHQAVKAIRTGECEMAIAGGVAMGTVPQRQSSDSDDVIASVQSIDNNVRTFDKDASGTIFGEGVAAVLLKSLDQAIEDGDHIYGVIKGTAINNDGASNGITAPSVKAQEEVILRALDDAGMSPLDIDYIEAHGTGTLLGDPIEIKGISQGFSKFTDKKQFCGVGTAKTNIGHTVGTSGIAGLIKVLLSMANEKIPPMREFNEPNPHIDFVNSPLYVAKDEIEWKKGQHNKKRVAAVSAFGFSGTNVHVIVEEPPELEDEGENVHSNIEVITFSAKTEGSLLRFLENFSAFLDREDSLDLNQLAYTTNACRGHYEHRLAMIVSNVEELKEKLSSILRTGIEFNEEDRVYYGQHKVVSDKKESRQEHDLTETKKRTLTIEANEGIAQWRESRSDVALSVVIGICKRYVKGAIVDFATLYQDTDIRKISIPTYAYEKTLYWGQLKEKKVSPPAYEKTYDHPFIENLVVSTSEVDIYSVNLSIDTHWAIRDHIILGKNMMSGTSFVEMIRAIGSLYYEGDSIAIHDVMFQVPLIVEEDEVKETRIIVKKQKDRYEIKVETKDENAGWITHSTGAVSKLEFANKRINVQALLERDGYEHMDVKGAFSEASSMGAIGFGERWDVVKAIRKNDKESIAEIELDDKFVHDLETFLFHPSLLDNSANNMGTVTFGVGMFLPFSYKDIRFYRPMTKNIISHSTLIPDNMEREKRQILSFNIRITDREGNVIAEVDEYRTKKVNKPSEISGKANQYHKIEWIKGVEETFSTWKGNHVLFFTDGSNVATELKEKFEASNGTIIEVRFDEEFEKIAENTFTINHTEESYVKLAKAIDLPQITHIVHMASNSAPANYEEIEQFQSEKSKSVDSIFCLTKALMNNGMKNKIEFILLTKNAYEVTGEETYISPFATAMASLGKVIPLEYPNVICKGIDFSEGVSAGAIFNEVCKELNGNDELQHIYRVALRNNNRYFERVYKLDKLQDFRKLETEIKEEGTYIITGGTGAIGVQASKFLAQEAKVNLSFLVRSKLPKRNEWDQIIAKGTDEKMIDIISNIWDIESAGAKVETYSCDISSYEDVKRAIAEIKSAHGKINGIVHCAGVPGEGYIVLKEKSVFDRVISPKVAGTWILDELTKDEDMDFMVLCSSMMTFIGAPGQSDYVVGNTFLDGYALKRNKEGKRTVTINWTAWSDAGMAKAATIRGGKSLFTPLTSEQGREVFEEIIQSNVTNLITGDLNLDIALQTGLHYEYLLKLSDEIKGSLNRLIRKMELEENKSEARNHEDVLIVGKNEGNYTEVEEKLAIIYGAVLNLEEIDIFDSFSDMGGDSIVATQLLKAIDHEYPGIVDITDIFSKATVIEMAEHIEANLVEKVNA
ncbi:SDR family NAD(P)-dependent oxidoreductase [Lysinibacillus xylanilyticus]|uniref:SDR family NAD(P)-dependent oxidoreductase n=1 Tax=Lysinibacillus xylanilyticus TaxID=582475 RepID=UPI002B251D6C|nr:SDR family NAD(P)-dependent oxidoreductase [Lysinibacillus xylanilyticus]MEB2302393.1 SDR family NAD(P)-dependent oxidoreductase [Lysinibacillus xylanilyticus]